MRNFRDVRFSEVSEQLNGYQKISDSLTKKQHVSLPDDSGEKRYKMDLPDDSGDVYPF